MGLPPDLVAPVSTWLKQRSFYVSINGVNSILYDVLLGTVLGSILGPVLYAIFISPVYDLEDVSSFADDNYTIRWNNDLQTAKVELEVSLSVITAWFKASGLKVNESKTEICLFSKGDLVPIDISLNGKILAS